MTESLASTWNDARLVARLFPPPAFDRLQYADTELGEGLEILSHVVTLGRQRVYTGAMTDPK